MLLSRGYFGYGCPARMAKSSVDLLGENDASKFVRHGECGEGNLTCAFAAAREARAGILRRRRKGKRFHASSRSRKSATQRANCCEVNCLPAASRRMVEALGSIFSLRSAAVVASRNSVISISA